jgi:hypothetical protein
MEIIHLWPEEPAIHGEEITISFTLDLPGSSQKRLWFRLPSSHRSSLSHSCDSFILASLFIAMQTPANIVVHGMVSPSLLNNLEEFQAAWVAWKPNKYHKIEISAEIEEEQKPAETSSMITAFSGGVDSCFTVYHRRAGRDKVNKEKIKTGLFIHGFDIPLNRIEESAIAAQKAQFMLNSLGIEMIPMTVNMKKQGDDWEDSYAAKLAACLMLLQNGYSAGIIPSSYPYINLQFPWGTNPLTDWLLSSQSFPIIHDGSGFTRGEKILEIAQWPEALKVLRVCPRGKKRGSNCCYCVKCVRNILYFRLNGLGLPACFENDVTNWQILRLRFPFARQISDYKLLLKMAEKTNAKGSWIQAVRFSIAINQAGYWLKKLFNKSETDRLLRL